MDGNEATDEISDFDDTEIKCLLLGDENEREKAGHALLEHFGPRLIGQLRNYGLSDDDKTSVIHDTIIELLEMAEQAKLDFEKPLAHIILRICKCNAVDLTRKRGRQIKADEELTEEISEAITDTKVGSAWKDAIGTEEARLIRTEFLAFVQALPTQQQLVAEVLANNLGYKLSIDEISEIIFRSKGKTVSKFVVKGALSQIRQKFKAILKRNYPDLPI